VRPIRPTIFHAQKEAYRRTARNASGFEPECDNGVLLDHLQQEKDQDDEEDEADTASAVVADPRPQAVAPKSEQQNKNDEKNNHDASRLTE
jgi:hypothetical protein